MYQSYSNLLLRFIKQLHRHSISALVNRFPSRICSCRRYIWTLYRHSVIPCYLPCWKCYQHRRCEYDNDAGRSRHSWYRWCWVTYGRFTPLLRACSIEPTVISDRLLELFFPTRGPSTTTTGSNPSCLSFSRSDSVLAQLSVVICLLFPSDGYSPSSKTPHPLVISFHS